VAVIVDATLSGRRSNGVDRTGKVHAAPECKGPEFQAKKSNNFTVTVGETFNRFRGVYAI